MAGAGVRTQALWLQSPCVRDHINPFGALQAVSQNFVTSKHGHLFNQPPLDGHCLPLRTRLAGYPCHSSFWTRGSVSAEFTPGS